MEPASRFGQQSLEAVVEQVGRMSMDPLDSAKKAVEAGEYVKAYYAFLSVANTSSDQDVRGEAYFLLSTLVGEGKIKTSDPEDVRWAYLREATKCEHVAAAVQLAATSDMSLDVAKRIYGLIVRKGEGSTKADAMNRLGCNAYKSKEFDEAKRYFKELADGDSRYRQEAARKYVDLTKNSDIDEASKYVLRMADDPLNPPADICLEYAKLQERRKTPEHEGIARTYYKMAIETALGDTKAEAALCW